MTAVIFKENVSVQ